MKTLLVLLLVGFGFFSPAEYATIVPQENVAFTVDHAAKKSTQATVVIDFGRRRNNCRGFGICRARILVRSTNERTGNQATLYIDSGRVTTIIFRKSTMSAKTINEQFAKGTFTVEEDFSEKLEHEGKEFLLELKAGKYKVEETKTSFNIGMPPN